MSTPETAFALIAWVPRLAELTAGSKQQGTTGVIHYARMDRLQALASFDAWSGFRTVSQELLRQAHLALP